MACHLLPSRAEFNSELIQAGQKGGLDVANQLQSRLKQLCQNCHLDEIDSFLVYCIK